MSSPSCAPSQNFKPKDSVVYHHVSPFFHGCFDLFGISSTPWCMVYTPRTSFSRPASLLAAPVCSLAEICCTSQGAAPNIPSGNLTVCHKELPICRWFTSWIWPYSMATFNNHGVNHFMEARHTSTGNSYLDLRQKRAVPIEKKSKAQWCSSPPVGSWARGPRLRQFLRRLCMLSKEYFSHIDFLVRSRSGYTLWKCNSLLLKMTYL